MDGILSQPPVQITDSVQGQILFGEAQANTLPSVSLGWVGFFDLQFMAESFSILLLAAMLGAVIGYHPASKHKINRLRDAEMAHVFVMYAVIGAVIGVAVREYGMVVGIVIFGIGGLIRVRSITDSTRDTVRLITVTLVGLIVGLGLLHFAVIAALFAFGLIYIFDTSPACRIRIDGLPLDRTADSAAAYRQQLTTYQCKIIAENQCTEKQKIEFIFRLPRGRTREQLELALNGITAELRGHADWEVA